MKTLIVYYSRTGITKKAAERVALEVGADLEEIKDLSDRRGALGYLKSGRDAMKNKLASIAVPQKNPAYYDLVVVCTPTWAYNMACAVRSYLTQEKDKIKKIAFLATHGSDGGERAVRKMAVLSGLEPIATLIMTSRELVQEISLEKISAFTNELRK